MSDTGSAPDGRQDGVVVIEHDVDGDSVSETLGDGDSAADPVDAACDDEIEPLAVCDDEGDGLSVTVWLGLRVGEGVTVGAAEKEADSPPLCVSLGDIERECVTGAGGDADGVSDTLAVPAPLPVSEGERLPVDEGVRDEATESDGLTLGDLVAVAVPLKLPLCVRLAVLDSDAEAGCESVTLADGVSDTDALGLDGAVGMKRLICSTAKKQQRSRLGRAEATVRCAAMPMRPPSRR